MDPGGSVSSPASSSLKTSWNCILQGSLTDIAKFDGVAEVDIPEELES